MKFYREELAKINTALESYKTIEAYKNKSYDVFSIKRLMQKIESELLSDPLHCIKVKNLYEKMAYCDSDVPVMIVDKTLGDRTPATRVWSEDAGQGKIVLIS